MTQKWNLQDIRPIEPRERRSARPPETIVEHKAPAVFDDPDDTQPVVIEDGNKKRRNYYWWGGALGAIVIFGALILSHLLAETTVVVEPFFRDPNVNAEFEAFPQRRDGALTYEVLTLDATKETLVKATGEKMVEEQARGTIEIFKTTPGAERLIKNTRFRSPDGLIFRIEESVVVPGAVTTGGASVPGSIRAAVFAETIGEQYNLAAGTRFTIPGFEENDLTDLYNAMYATNPEPITGGFAGPQFIVDDTELSTARQKLQVELRNELLAQVAERRPSGFISFEGSYAFTYTQQPSTSFGGDQVNIVEQAILQVPVFKADDFARFIAEQTIPTYNRAPVRIEGVEDMLFRYRDPNHNAAVIANLESLTFTVVGKPRIVWEYDEVALRKDLAGKSRTVMSQIQEAYADSVDKFTISLKPFYRRSFPENGDDIRLIEQISEEESE